MIATSTITIPLNKLAVSPDNVRKTLSSDTIGELAASIQAHGLLQNLIVTPAKKGAYHVNAGGRRLRALQQLARDGLISDDHPVPCQVRDGTSDAKEISLAENAVREQMHPADEFEAFRHLVDDGVPIADIGARFGVTETVVEKRLKLARVSARVLEAYRAGDLTLEKVMAFTVTDNHEAQDEVLQSLRGHEDADDIRATLLEDEITSIDRRVRFVTLKAFEKAGGTVRRDLFSGEDAGVIEDAALLRSLTTAKLQKKAKEVAKEGWKWVEIRDDFDYGEWNDCQRRHAEPVPLTPEQATEQDELQRKFERLENAWHAADDDSDYPERCNDISKRLDELDDREEVWPAETLAIAGAIVAIGPDGKPDIRRGFILPADKPKPQPKTKTVKTVHDDGSVTDREVEDAFILPASLLETLTAHRSAALAATLMEEPEIALAALAHSLALQAFYRVTGNGSCLRLNATSYLHRDAKNSSAARAIEATEESWNQTLPGDESGLWDWCLAQDQATLLRLLAFCVASTIDCVVSKTAPNGDRVQHAGMLATALDLDMAQWFTPTAESYFGKVNKAGILRALREAKGGEAPAWAAMKKSELAVLAEREMAATGWLPEPLRSPEADDGEGDIAA